MLMRGRAWIPLNKSRVTWFHSARGAIEDKRWPGWEVVIGIEVHAQIKARRKLFSNTLVSENLDSPNTNVSLFDAAFPGTLPRLNGQCVDLALRTAVALNSEVQLHSAFDRKHYFYPDLPAGYQITQHYAPLAKNGYLKLWNKDATVRIQQLQLEQDTAKSTANHSKQTTYIDLNRAGMALMEIVSEPDIRSPEEAGDYIKTLQALLRAVGSSDGNMEQGSFRCDVNVSVNRPGDPLGTRCEIKNLNSVKFTVISIRSEILRHIALLGKGIAVDQETRGFDEDKAETFRLRSKEDAHDYRYMPDPNLPPLILSSDVVNLIKQRMPELPEATRRRLLDRGLSAYDVDVLMAWEAGKEVHYDGEQGNSPVAYFDEVSKDRDPKIVVNWMRHELLGQLTLRKESFQHNSISIQQLGELIDLVQNGSITGTSGKLLLRHLLKTRSTESPSKLAEELSLTAMSGSDTTGSPDLVQLCQEAIAAMPAEAEAVRRGSLNVVNKIVGRIMKTSRGRADATTLKTILTELLSESRSENQGGSSSR